MDSEGGNPLAFWRTKMKEIKEMKDETLIKTLNALWKELNRRRAEVWERYTGVKYPMKNPLKKEVQDE